nr:ABC transporter permease [Serinicoccus hydrothermalis]
MRIPAGLGLAFIVLPLLALLLRTDWADLTTHLSAPVVGQSLRLSAVTTSATMVLVWLLGTPLAWLLARSESRLTAWARALVTVPLVLPPVVGGVALLLAWGRRGVLGGPLEAWFGITVPFTTVAVVMAELFVALPFYVVAVEGAMRGLDRRYDQVAATLGAGPLRTFLTVVVPMVLPGIAAGSALAWARALGEFGATITFAGSFPGRTQTAPLGVYAALEQDPQAAIALSVVMLTISVVVLGALRTRWLR